MALRRRAWIPVALILIAVLTAGGLSVLSRPTYTATATVFAAPSSNGPKTVSFIQVASSATVADRVVRSLKLAQSFGQLQQHLQVSLISNDLYRVSVSEPTADVATTVTNEVARQAVAFFREISVQVGNGAANDQLTRVRDRLKVDYQAALKARLTFEAAHPNAAPSNAPPKDVAAAAQMLQLQLEEDAAANAYRDSLAKSSQTELDRLSQAQDVNVFVLDPATAKPDAASRVSQTLLAAGLAFVVGILLVFLLDYLDNKALRTPEAAEEIIGAPVIGIVPHATSQSMRPAKGGLG